MRRSAGFSFMAVVIGLLGDSSAYADTISNWTGAAGGTNWSVAGNWMPAAVPNNSGATKYSVTIGSKAFTTLDISPTIDSLVLNGILQAPPSGPAPLLTVVKGATINGVLAFGDVVGEPFPPFPGPGSLSVGGNLSISSSARIVSVNGSVEVGGNFTNAATHLVELYSRSGTDLFHVGGTLTNQKDSLMLLGAGRCFNAPCNTLFPYTNSPVPGPLTSVGTITNKGQLFSWSSLTGSGLVNYGSTFLVANSADFGTVKNGGTIGLLNSCCSIAPETTAGLNVGTGGTTQVGYNQSADGVLDELLLGRSSYGTIAAGSWLIPPHGREVGYEVSLNGTLDIMLRDGFVPSIGESFTILTFAPGFLNGTFDKVTWDAFDNGQGKFLVSYNNGAGDVVVTAEATPEPRTMLLLAPALGFVFWLHRRRKL